MKIDTEKYVNSGEALDLLKSKDGKRLSKVRLWQLGNNGTISTITPFRGRILYSVKDIIKRNESWGLT